MITIDKQTLQKYDVAGPRYTSYPTAPEWSKQVDAAIYREKLQAFGRNDKTVSLYVHIPFCEQLCYFCACNKVIRAAEDKVGDEYLEFLFKEIDLVANTIGRRKAVKQLHWGGGTPTYLSEDQSRRLFDKIAGAFDIDFEGEIAIEIDPRTVNQLKIKSLRAMGFNRISMGIQDFDEKVQDDINRVQPYTAVKAVHEWCREAGFHSVNFDLIYGLPYQTRATFHDTVTQVIALKPDRIALYSFAYVPWLSKPQNKFNLDAMPLADEKLDIFIAAREQLLCAGYQAIAMDHFALAGDAMAIAYHQGNLHRNFMGYTLKPADEFIGLGVSAIGFVEDTYVQNVKTLPDYYKYVHEGQMPTERGALLSEDDRIRRQVINSLMCTFRVNKRKFFDTWGKEFEDYFHAEAEHIAQCVQDGLMAEDHECLAVTDSGKIFIRNICMGFDYYLRQQRGTQRYSRTV